MPAYLVGAGRKGDWLSWFKVIDHTLFADRRPGRCCYRHCNNSSAHWWKAMTQTLVGWGGWAMEAYRPMPLVWLHKALICIVLFGS